MLFRSEIRIPKTLKQFGYRIDKSDILRRAALVRASQVAGRESVLFNLSSLVVLNRKNDNSMFQLFKNDLDYIVKRLGGAKL